MPAKAERGGSIKLPDFISILYPRRCPVCDDIVASPEKLIHTACLKKLSPVRQPVCKRCGKEVLSDRIEYCFDCSRHKRSFESGMALLNYNESAKHSMSAIKYRNKREYLDFYAEAIDVRFYKRVQNLKPQVLIPVPVHASRKRKRGFNQAEELAVRLGKRWGLPVESSFLMRTKKTTAQRDLDPQERLRNLQEAFGTAKERTAPDTVLLVDDIYTTGSTVEACTRVLLAAGVKKVWILVICTGADR